MAAEALAYEYSHSVGLPVEGAICCLDSTILIDAGVKDKDGYRSGEAWLACRADGYVYSGDYFEGHNSDLSVVKLRLYKTTLHNKEGGLVTFNYRHSTKTIPAFATVDSDGDKTDLCKDEPHIASGAPFKSAHRLHISTADQVYNISKTKLQMGTVETQIGKLKQKWHLLQSWGSLANLGYNLRKKIWLCALLITNLDYIAEFDAGRKRVEEEGRLTTIASTSTPEVARTSITRAMPQVNKVVPPRRITKTTK